MGYCIVKVDRDPGDDRYLVWSTVPDGFIYTGTRAEVTQFYREEFGRQGVASLDRNFERAGLHGSDSGMGRFFWDCEPHRMQAPDGWVRIPRPALGEYWERYEAWATAEEDGPEPDISDLVLPLEDEEA